MALTHLGARLLVSDFTASFRFYRDVLGFTPTFGDENDVYADFDTGGGTGIALFRRDLMAQAVGVACAAPAPRGDVPSFVLVFSVPSVADVDATCARLREKGVRVVTEPQDRPEWGIRTAHFLDPDGFLIEINSGLLR
jgi:catechol 2,3-dioxygenase-like lactoylglutathione lyase family enzyme